MVSTQPTNQPDEKKYSIHFDANAVYLLPKLLIISAFRLTVHVRVNSVVVALKPPPALVNNVEMRA